MGRVSLRFAMAGLEDRFGQSGATAELFREYDLDTAGILRRCHVLLAQK